MSASSPFEVPFISDVCSLQTTNQKKTIVHKAKRGGWGKVPIENRVFNRGFSRSFVLSVVGGFALTCGARIIYSGILFILIFSQQVLKVLFMLFADRGGGDDFHLSFELVYPAEKGSADLDGLRQFSEVIA